MGRSAQQATAVTTLARPAEAARSRAGSRADSHFGQRGGSVGLALQRGSGRAFVWGDEWVEFDSEWQSLPEIKTFWVNAVGWLSGAL